MLVRINQSSEVSYCINFSLRADQANLLYDLHKNVVKRRVDRDVDLNRSGFIGDL